MLFGEVAAWLGDGAGASPASLRMPLESRNTDGPVGITWLLVADKLRGASRCDEEAAQPIAALDSLNYS